MLAQKPLQDIVTFTRSSSATRFNTSGVLETVGNNVPRLDYEPADVPVLGPELVTNGDFSNGTTGWTTRASSASVASGVVQITATATNYPGIEQTISGLVPGKIYVISGATRRGSCAAESALAVTGIGQSEVSNNSTAFKYSSTQFVATSTTHTIGPYIKSPSAIAGETFFSLGVSVKEIIGYTVRKGDPKGILIEEQRTNFITNSVLAGAGASSWPTGWGADAAPTGLTVSVIGAGTEAGMNYVDFRINGTPAAGGQWQVAIGGGSAASSSNPWTLSAFTKLVGGSMVNVSNPRIAMNYVNSGWSYIGESNSNINTGVGSLAAQRAFVSATPIANTANIVPYFKVSFSAGQAIDATFRLALPQLEQGSLPTSAIPTSGSQVTRAADKPAVPASLWLKALQGTLYVEYSDDCLNSSTLAQLSSGDGGAAVWIVRGPTGVNCMINNGGLYRSAAAVGLSRAVHKAAVTWDAAGNFMSCCDGQAVASNTQPNGAPPITGGLRIGCDNLVAAWANGHIRAAKYFPDTRTAAQLQTLTA